MSDANNMLETDAQRKLWASMKRTFIWIANGSTNCNGRLTNDSKHRIKNIILDISKTVDLEEISRRDGLDNQGHELAVQLSGCDGDELAPELRTEADKHRDFSVSETADPRYIRVM